MGRRVIGYEAETASNSASLRGTPFVSRRRSGKDGHWMLQWAATKQNRQLGGRFVGAVMTQRLGTISFSQLGAGCRRAAAASVESARVSGTSSETNAAQAQTGYCVSGPASRRCKPEGPLMAKRRKGTTFFLFL